MRKHIHVTVLHSHNLIVQLLHAKLYISSHPNTSNGQSIIVRWGRHYYVNYLTLLSSAEIDFNFTLLT